MWTGDRPSRTPGCVVRLCTDNQPQISRLSPHPHPVAKQPLLYIISRPSRLCTLFALMAELFSVRTQKKNFQAFPPMKMVSDVGGWVGPVDWPGSRFCPPLPQSLGQEYGSGLRAAEKGRASRPTHKTVHYVE